jgi:hypothetical protein
MRHQAVSIARKGNTAGHARFWPLADIGWCTAHVRFRGQSGHSQAFVQWVAVNRPSSKQRPKSTITATPRGAALSFTPLSSARRRDGHRLSATGEGETLGTKRAYHDSLDKRFGNFSISRPFDDEVRPGSSARILSGNEGLR